MTRSRERRVPVSVRIEQQLRDDLLALAAADDRCEGEYWRRVLRLHAAEMRQLGKLPVPPLSAPNASATLSRGENGPGLQHDAGQHGGALAGALVTAGADSPSTS